MSSRKQDKGRKTATPTPMEVIKARIAITVNEYHRLAEIKGALGLDDIRYLADADDGARGWEVDGAVADLLAQGVLGGDINGLHVPADVDLNRLYEIGQQYGGSLA